jgi:hypothetical protein
MSKKSRAKGKQKRLKEKRARKAAMKAQYQRFAGMGANSKSKRFRSRVKKTIRAISHPDGSCGNSGCIKCHKINYQGFLKDGKPYRMPQWMYLRWVK